MQIRIFNIVEATGKQGIDVFMLCDRLYTGPSGGPEHAQLSVRQQMHHIRERLKKFGVAIKATGGPESRYFLTKVKNK
jgi:hypothetical protein